MSLLITFRRPTLLALLGGMLIFSAYPGASMAEDLKTVRIGSAVRSIFSLPLYVADQKGFFKDEGLRVDINFFTGGPSATAALLGGSEDVTVCALEDQIKVVSAGQNIVSLMTVQSSFSGALIVRKEIADKLGRRPTVRDLKGLNLGTSDRGGFADSAARYLLASTGFVPDTDVTMVPIHGFDKHLAAGEAKQIDASLMIEPWQTIAVEGTKHWSYVLNFSVGEGPDVFQKMSYVTLQTTRTYAQDKRSVLEKLIRAIVRAQNYIAHAQNVDELADITKKIFPSTDINVLKTSIQHQLKTYDPIIAPEAIAKNVALLKAGGYEGSAPGYDALVDSSLKNLWSNYEGN